MRLFQQKYVPRPWQGPGVPLDQLQTPFDLDIGCGTGDFAIQWAKTTNHPVIAIEKTRSRFLKFEKKCRAFKKPENLWPIHTNAVWWLAHYGKQNSFQHIFLLYPNPYPKKKQAHLRWVNRPFMSFLLDLLVRGGQLELRTNKQNYYEEFKEKIQLFSFMRLKEDRSLQSSAPAQTLFEKKYLKRREQCHILKYQKMEKEMLDFANPVSVSFTAG